MRVKGEISPASWLLHSLTKENTYGAFLCFVRCAELPLCFVACNKTALVQTALVMKITQPNGCVIFMAEEGRFELPLQISPD